MASSLSGAGSVASGKNLTCGVCQEIFRSPRLLPCFHTFCLYCVEGLVRTHGRSFPCPQCRQPAVVPPQGALGFQRNFYITEEELERERTGPNTAVCPTHPMEPLVFFCVQCDSAICIRCKLTKHQDHGQTEDLSATAARSAGYLESSKGRLDSTITLLDKKAALAQDSLRAAEQKGAALKEQVKEQTECLVQKVEHAMATVLSDVDTANVAIKKKLTHAARFIQQELDSLVQLRQSVHHALSAKASDADKVFMEKEMRNGKGNEGHLRRIKKNIPKEMYRPGLHFDDNRITFDDIQQVVGCPVLLSMPFKIPREILVPVFQFTEETRDGVSKEVLGLCQLNSDTYVVQILDQMTGNLVEIRIDEKGRTQLTELKEQRTYKRYADTMSFYSPYYYEKGGKTEFCLNSKSYHRECFQVKHIPEEKTFIVRLDVQKGEGLKATAHFIQGTNLAEPAAFDATATGDMIALIEIHRDPESWEYKGEDQVSREHKDEDKETWEYKGEDQESREYKGEVCLYHSKENKPFATYKPQERGFCPSDVCFWQENNQVKLLVADRQNDCVHVVSFEGNEVCFERYLAAGDNNLIRPTALNIDDKGRIWIGCENGQVLRCETQGLVSLSDDCQSETEEESIADNDSNVSDEEMLVDNSSTRSLALAVENSSRSSTTQSHVSEDME